MARKRALCVGINDYPYEGSDLNGCVNDSLAWASLLTEHFGVSKAEVKLLNDSEATKKNIMDGLKTLLSGASAGDVLVFTNSSHGSYVADTSGDEETYDEILCPYDIKDNQIVDDELRDLFGDLPPGCLTVILDNCFSGTSTRAAVSDIIPGMKTPDDRRVRFLSPALRGQPVLVNPWTARPKSREKHPQSRMREVLIAGCTDREYSYDAMIEGRYHGAMTFYALQAIKAADYKITYRRLHQRLQNLISTYPQHPQLEGHRENLDRQIFS